MKAIKGRGFSNPCRIQAASQQDHSGTAPEEQLEAGEGWEAVGAEKPQEDAVQGKRPLSGVLGFSLALQRL